MKFLHFSFIFYRRRSEKSLSIKIKKVENVSGDCYPAPSTKLWNFNSTGEALILFNIRNVDDFHKVAQLDHTEQENRSIKSRSKNFWSKVCAPSLGLVGLMRRRQS